MSITLTIPDSVVQGLRLPEPELEPRLRAELAIALYAQGVLSLGKAAELAGTTRFLFGHLLAARGIPRHYTEDDLARDLAYGSGE
jgi:predicted HTH domain antitoxin